MTVTYWNVSRHRNNGFTLLELLIAIALSAAIVTIAGMMVRHANHTQKKVDDRQAQRQQLQDAYRHVEHLSSHWSGTLFAGDGAEITLETMDARGTRRIRLRCEQGGDGNSTDARVDNDRRFSLVIYRPPENGHTRKEPTPEIAETLIPSLTQCAFAYLSPPASANSAPVWVAAWTNRLPPSPPPRLIRLRLATLQGAVPPWIFPLDKEASR